MTSACRQVVVSLFVVAALCSLVLLAGCRSFEISNVRVITADSESFRQFKLRESGQKNPRAPNVLIVFDSDRNLEDMLRDAAYVSFICNVEAADGKRIMAAHTSRIFFDGYVLNSSDTSFLEKGEIAIPRISECRGFRYIAVFLPSDQQDNMIGDVLKGGLYRGYVLKCHVRVNSMPFAYARSREITISEDVAKASQP